MRISDWSSDVCSSDLITSLDAPEDRLWRWQATGELLALLVEFQRPQPRREARQLVRRPPLRWRWAERQRIAFGARPELLVQPHIARVAAGDRKSTRLNSSH